MNAVDDVFSPAGFAVALMHGCELSVEVGPSVTSAVTVTKDDLSCPECGESLSVPKRKPAFFLAVNKRFNDGLCERCDPP